MTELLRALNDRSLSGEDRLKVACYLWKQELPDLAENGAFLAKWISEELCSAYGKKVRTRPPLGVRCKLWQFLSLVLHTVCHQEGQFQPSITAHLLQCMSEVFTEVCSSDDDEVLQCARNVLRSLESVLSLSPCPAVLYKYELMVSLLMSLMNSALANLRRGCDPPDELFPTLKCLLKHYTYLQGTRGNHKKVFTATCNQLLEPVLHLKYLLSAPSSPTVVTEVIGHLDEILASLFNRDTLVEFTSAITLDNEPRKGSAAVSYARTLFERLKKLLDPLTTHEPTFKAALVGIAAIYEAFLAQNSKEKQVSRDVEFQFFCKLLRLLGCAVTSDPATDKENGLKLTEEGEMEEDKDASDLLSGLAAKEWHFVLSELCLRRDGSHPKPSDGCEGVTMAHEEGANARKNKDESDAQELSLAVLATLSKCLSLLLEYGVYQVAEDNAAGGRQFSQLQLLSVKLLKRTNLHNLGGVFGCLHSVLRLNHKILEPLLPGVWVILITWQHRSFGQVKARMNLFACEAIDVYFKLRQLRLLLEKLLSALDMVYDLQLWLPPSQPLTPQAEHQLAGHIQELPPGQCLDILETFCQAFEKYLSRIKLLPASKPPRKKRKKDTLLAHKATTTGVHSESLMAVTRQLVDVFGTVLSYVPLDVWGGRCQGRALAILRRVRDEICHPFLDACPSVSPDMQPSLCSASLHLAVKCTELELGLRTIFPDLLHPDWLVMLSWEPSLGRMMPANWNGLVEGPLGPQCEYSMRKLAMLQLRFSPPDGEVTPSRSDLLDFVFDASPPSILSNAVWSGQLLDISEDNAHIATCSLLLSQLPLLYEQCLGSHLKTVAGFVLQAMLSVHKAKSETGGDTIQPMAEEGLTCGQAIGILIDSPGFPEMRRLHESLLESYFQHAASSLPKCFPKELQKTLLQCTAEVTEPSPESLHSALECVLCPSSDQPDASGCTSPKKSRKLKKWLEQLAAYRELMEALPLAAMHTGILQKSLLAVTTWCVSLAHLIYLDSADLLLLIPTLTDMQYLLAWLLHSLLKCPKDSKSSRQRVLRVYSGIPVEALLQWAYSVARHHSMSSAGKDSSVVVSSLVVAEMVFKIGLECGNYPSNFVKLVGSDVSAAVKRKESCWDVFVAEECLKMAVNLTCKTLSVLSPKHQHVEILRAVLEPLLETILKILERISRKSSCSPYGYPAIVSAFVTILHSRNDLVSSRSVEVASMLLTHAQMDRVDHESTTFTAGQLQKLFAMVDALSLPAAISKSAVELKLPQQLKLLPSWSRLQQVLGFLLEKVGYQVGVRTLVKEQSKKYTKLGQVVGKETKDVASVVFAKVTQTMSQLLTAASREEIASVFEHISKQDSKSSVSVSKFCCCWNVILDSRLSEDSRRELRRWLSKVLLKCMSIAHLYQGNATVLSEAVHLATRLVAIPTQVGLDSRAVMMSLHLCSCLDSPNSCSETELVKLGDGIARLLSAMARNHTVVATLCPAPIFSTVNKLIDIAVMEGQVIEVQLLENQGGSATIDRINSAVQFAGQAARVMEVLSNLKVFAKYVPYPIGEFITSSSTHPVHASVKKALLPGIFSLLKLSSEQDASFIQASLDASMQETFQTLLAEYKRFHRFSGRM